MSTETGRWPHLGDIAFGLLEARLSGVDFWDTDVGQRLLAAKKREAPKTREAPERPPVRLRPRGRRRSRPR